MKSILLLLFLDFWIISPSFSATEKKPIPLTITKEKFPDAEYYSIFDRTKVEIQEYCFCHYREHRLIKIIVSEAE